MADSPDDSVQEAPPTPPQAPKSGSHRVPVPEGEPPSTAAPPPEEGSKGKPNPKHLAGPPTKKRRYPGLTRGEKLTSTWRLAEMSNVNVSTEIARLLGEMAKTVPWQGAGPKRTASLLSLAIDEADKRGLEVVDGARKIVEEVLGADGAEAEPTWVWWGAAESWVTPDYWPSMTKYLLATGDMSVLRYCTDYPTTRPDGTLIPDDDREHAERCCRAELSLRKSRAERQEKQKAQEAQEAQETPEDTIPAEAAKAVRDAIETDSHQLDRDVPAIAAHAELGYYEALARSAPGKRIVVRTNPLDNEGFAVDPKGDEARHGHGLLHGPGGSVVSMQHSQKVSLVRVEDVSQTKPPKAPLGEPWVSYGTVSWRDADVSASFGRALRYMKREPVLDKVARDNSWFWLEADNIWAHRKYLPHWVRVLIAADRSTWVSRGESAPTEAPHLSRHRGKPRPVVTGQTATGRSSFNEHIKALDELRIRRGLNVFEAQYLDALRKQRDTERQLNEHPVTKEFKERLDAVLPEAVFAKVAREETGLPEERISGAEFIEEMELEVKWVWLECAGMARWTDAKLCSPQQIRDAAMGPDNRVSYERSRPARSPNGIVIPASGILSVSEAGVPVGTKMVKPWWSGPNPPKKATAFVYAAWLKENPDTAVLLLESDDVDEPELLYTGLRVSDGEFWVKAREIVSGRRHAAEVCLHPDHQLTIACSSISPSLWREIK